MRLNMKRIRQIAQILTEQEYNPVARANAKNLVKYDAASSAQFIEHVNGVACIIRMYQHDKAL